MSSIGADAAPASALGSPVIEIEAPVTSELETVIPLPAVVWLPAASWAIAYIVPFVRVGVRDLGRSRTSPCTAGLVVGAELVERLARTVEVRKSTAVTPTLSDALAAAVIVPLTMSPAFGAVTVTSGGVVSSSDEASTRSAQSEGLKRLELAGGALKNRSELRRYWKVTPSVCPTDAHMSVLAVRAQAVLQLEHHVAVDRSRRIGVVGVVRIVGRARVVDVEVLA